MVTLAMFFSTRVLLAQNDGSGRSGSDVTASATANVTAAKTKATTATTTKAKSAAAKVSDRITGIDRWSFRANALELLCTVPNFNVEFDVSITLQPLVAGTHCQIQLGHMAQCTADIGLQYVRNSPRIPQMVQDEAERRERKADKGEGILPGRLRKRRHILHQTGQIWNPGTAFRSRSIVRI